MPDTLLDNKLDQLLLASSCFSLGLSAVFSDQLSTLAIIVLAAITLFILIKKRYEKPNYRNYVLLLLPALLLVVHGVGFITGESSKASAEFVRLLPLIILPATFISIAQFYTIKKVEKALLIGMLSGLAIFFIVCNLVIILTIFRESQPIEYLFRWRYLNFNFTKPFDAHPAYIGLFITLSMMLLLFRDIVANKWRIPIALFLLLLLVQLVARNALVVCLILLATYGIRQKSKLLLLLLILGISAITIISIYHPKDFLYNKFFYFLKDDATIKQDNRFSRLEASYRVFKMAPIFGVGPGNDDKLRVQEYLKINDRVAYEKGYNAHNQFFEYLSTYGIFGLLLFSIFLVLLTVMLIKKRQWLYLSLLVIFLLSCSTESLLVRSLGVKYFALLIGLIFLSLIVQSKTNTLESKRHTI